MKSSSIKSECNPMTSSTWPMAKFLGIIMLGLGVSMLVDYNASIAYMMSVAGKLQPMMGQLWPLVEVFSKAVAYAWPVVATLIGLSYLASFKKRWASWVFLCFLAVFALAHLWTGDMTGAIWDVLVALFVSVMRGMCSLEKTMVCGTKK